MSVLEVKEMWSRRNGAFEAKDSIATRFLATTAYQVTHAADDTETTILLDTALPKIHDTFPGLPAVYCTRLRREPAGPIMSIVQADWEGDPGEPENGDPTTQPPKWVWSNTITSEPVDTDADGLPLCNSNGELKEGFTRDVSDFTLTVTRNFKNVDPYTLRQYLDSVNSDAWGPPDSIWPAGTAALRTFTAEAILSNSDRYYQVNAQIDFRVPYLTIPARAWWYRYRNDGMNVRGGVRVSFSGGGATAQATAYAITSGGSITNIYVSYGGAGYTSAPTVSISADAGSGGTATATISNGRVVSVSVTNGGSGYTSKLVRAVDGNKEPEPRPVCLKADGSREYNPNAAIWIERKRKQYTLPYTGLGLFT